MIQKIQFQDADPFKVIMRMSTKFDKLYKGACISSRKSNILDSGHSRVSAVATHRGIGPTGFTLSWNGTRLSNEDTPKMMEDMEDQGQEVSRLRLMQ